MSSSIYKYYPSSGDNVKCIVCQYAYRKDAPLSTLQKHLRVKHGFSIRNPLSPEELTNAIEQAKVPIFTPYLGPAEAKPRTQKAKPEPLKRVNIGDLLNSIDHENQTDSRVIESSIVNWIIKEKIPLSIASTESFYNMLHQINPAVLLPNRQRLHQLVTDEFRTILDGTSSGTSVHYPPTPESSSEKFASPRK